MPVTLKLDRLPDALQEEVQRSVTNQTQLFNLVNQEFQKLQNQLQAVTRERDQLRQQNLTLSKQLANATSVSEDKSKAAPGETLYSSVGTVPQYGSDKGDRSPDLLVVSGCFATGRWVLGVWLKITN
eukprot:symbB.v1.2.038793.t1/scaffold6176.1/size21658/2